MVWRPGQKTVIHDHIAWCVFGVLQGVEYETLYRADGDHLTEIGRTANQTGDVSGFAPPGDIHRVHNTGDETAISLHIYGADSRRRRHQRAPRLRLSYVPNQRARRTAPNSSFSAAYSSEGS